MQEINLGASNSHASLFKSDGGKSYSYWRLRILYSTILGYAAYYFVRANFALAMPFIAEEYGYSKVQLGLVLTAFSVVYGIGKFLNGYLSDRSDARYFMGLGLLGSAIINYFMGHACSLVYFIVLWGLNGWMQSMGAPPVGRMLTHWFAPKELGTKWSIWSCSHQVGNAVIAVLAGWLVLHYGWRAAFFTPAVIAVCISLFLMNRLRDNPERVGLPDVEIYKNDVLAPANSKDKLTPREVLTLVLKNKYVWYISLANLFLYVPRMGVLNWAPTFLREFKGVSIAIAGLQHACFDIAGLVGGITAGILSDRIFKGRRGPVATIYLLFLSASFILLWKIPPGHAFLDAIALIISGFLVAGPQVLVGIALADFASKRAVGVSNGFAGIMGYVAGASISGAGVGHIVDVWGWDGGFIIFIICSLLGAFFFSLTWNANAGSISDNFKGENASCN